MTRNRIKHIIEILDYLYKNPDRICKTKILYHINLTNKNLNVILDLLLKNELITMTQFTKKIIKRPIYNITEKGLNNLKIGQQALNLLKIFEELEVKDEY